MERTAAQSRRMIEMSLRPVYRIFRVRRYMACNGDRYRFICYNIYFIIVIRIQTHNI